MIYAIAFVGLLQLMTMGMVAAVIQQQAHALTNAATEKRDLTAALMEMAGEPRAARIVERQASPAPEPTVYRANRPTPYGLRAR